MSENLFLKKKIFFILLKHIKTDLIFLLSKNHFFLVLKNRRDTFFKSKDFILCDKHRSKFLSPKTAFLDTTK